MNKKIYEHLSELIIKTLRITNPSIINFKNEFNFINTHIDTNCREESDIDVYLVIGGTNKYVEDYDISKYWGKSIDIHNNLEWNDDQYILPFDSLGTIISQYSADILLVVTDIVYDNNKEEVTIYDISPLINIVKTNIELINNKIKAFLTPTIQPQRGKITITNIQIK